jgi:hypothetical protein
VIASDGVGESNEQQEAELRIRVFRILMRIFSLISGNASPISSARCPVLAISLLPCRSSLFCEFQPLSIVAVRRGPLPERNSWHEQWRRVAWESTLVVSNSAFRIGCGSRLRPACHIPCSFQST